MTSQTSVGQIIGDRHEERDAIHIAVAPVTATETLAPGQGIRLVAGTTDQVELARINAQAAIGIVDPFLTGAVFPGQRFWMFLLPNTITSLRHNWSHPAFQTQTVQKVIDAEKANISVSEAWLRTFAENVGADYNTMMDVARSHCQNDWSKQDWLIDGGKWEGQPTPDAFWVHFAVVTGLVRADGDDYPGGSIFSCSC